MPHLEESVANGDNQPSRTVGVGAMGLDSWSELEVDGEAVQCLRPSRQAERFEGLASPSGHILAAATADTNAVLLFRRKPDGLFEEAPYCRIGSGHPLEYPHDVAFSGSGDIELLAVAQRAGSIVVFKKNKEDETFVRSRPSKFAARARDSRSLMASPSCRPTTSISRHAI